MEGNLHYTGKVAGFCHHVGIDKEHQLFILTINCRQSYIKDLSRNNDSKYPVVNQSKISHFVPEFSQFQ